MPGTGAVGGGGWGGGGRDQVRISYYKSQYHIFVFFSHLPLSQGISSWVNMFALTQNQKLHFLQGLSVIFSETHLKIVCHLPK